MKKKYRLRCIHLFTFNITIRPNHEFFIIKNMDRWTFHECLLIPYITTPVILAFYIRFYPEVIIIKSIFNVVKNHDAI